MQPFEKIYNMVDIAPTACEIMGIQEPAQCVGTAIEEITNDLKKYNKVCLLAMDAFGYHVFSTWRHVMPYMDSLHKNNSIIVSSIMPTKTPMNFATMITGTTLKVHGAYSKEHDLTCESIFDVLKKVNKKGAGMGYDTYTGGQLLARYSQIPTIYPYPTGEIEWDEGFYPTLKDLMEKSPDFIIAQIGMIDTVFHRVGPSSPEVFPMLRNTDEMLSKAIPMLNENGYGVILYADHGQQDCATGGTHGTAHWKERLVPCTWV